MHRDLDGPEIARSAGFTSTGQACARHDRSVGTAHSHWPPQNAPAKAGNALDRIGDHSVFTRPDGDLLSPSGSTDYTLQADRVSGE